MDLEYEFSYHADLLPPVDVGPGVFGHRMFFEVSGGTFEGERLKGTIGTGGGDWLLLGPDGHGRLDVRATFTTHDGAVLYLSYHGIIQVTEGVMAVLGGGTQPTDYGDQYFRTSPRWETGDERYAWMTQALWVGEGRLLPGPAVEYRVYRVT